MVNGSAGVKENVENAQFMQSSPMSVMSQNLIVINIHELKILIFKLFK
jgi:hypothetical protein